MWCAMTVELYSVSHKIHSRRESKKKRCGRFVSYFVPSVIFSIHVYALSAIILDSTIIMMFSCMCCAILNEEKIGRQNSLRKVRIIIIDTFVHGLKTFLAVQCATCQSLFVVPQAIAEQPPANEMNCFR